MIFWAHFETKLQGSHRAGEVNSDKDLIVPGRTGIREP